MQRTNDTKEDPMMTIQRIGIARQITVGNAIADALAADRPSPILSGTRARCEEVVSATAVLRVFAGYKAVDVYTATSKILIGLEENLAAQERSLRDGVVPMGEAQHQALARVSLVRSRVFPQGVGLARLPMDMQWPRLVAIRSAVQEPPVAAAIDAMSLRPHVDHALAHIEVYGRVIGQQTGGAGAGKEQACEAWTEAFRLLAAQVLLDYQKDAAMQKELLGPYQVQLANQRAAARASRSRKSASAPATGSATATGAAPAPAPATGAATATGAAPAPAPATGAATATGA
ncbi:MAG: hypothetical protein IT372_01825, partial [Polyangiaceae bacterium]|nr:hypothetical protein [Polyangiaceae bacterium]